MAPGLLSESTTVASELVSVNPGYFHIVITRMVCDQRTRNYIARRTTEGHTKKEAIRCLKRYIAREIYQQLPRPRPLDSP